MKITPAKGFVLVKRKDRKGAQIDQEMVNKTNLLPPSDYIIEDGGEYEIAKGTEVLIAGSTHLTPVKDKKDLYIMDYGSIVAFIAKK